MGWRKIQKEDIKRGTIIRLKSLDRDGGYSTATIISVNEQIPSYQHVKVSRPYVYAHKDFDTKDPLVGAETFAIGITRMLAEESDVEVFEGRDGVRSMTT